jgi:two-component system, OmpR family, response regulator
MVDAPKVLIVDDDREIRDLLARFLRKHGLRVETVADGRAMARALDTGRFDLVVLDLMLPGEDGLSLCRHLRATSSLPVIMLTAVAEDTDRIVGLEIGADDYVTKPFNPRELLARIKAVLRRTNSLPCGREAIATEAIRFDRWTLKVAQRELIDQEGVAMPLSTAEFQLLAALLRHPKMVLSRDQLLDLTRGRAAAVFDRSIDNQISRLRRKVEADPKNPALIKTVWGGGYMLAADVERR